MIEFHSGSEPPAVAPAGAGAGAGPPAGRRGLVGPLLVVALLLSVASLALSLAGRSSEAVAPREVVVIERQLEPEPVPPSEPKPEPSQPAPTEPAPEPTPEPTDPVEPPVAADKPERRPVAPVAAPDPRVLTRRFGRKQARIEACFQRHGKALGTAPQLAIHFKVDTQGRVQQAGLLPESMAGTPLGQCLLGVAKSTQFGPQQRDVSFRIPISAQLVGDAR